MPSSGHWAISPTGLLDVLHLIEQKQPKVVLEIGSGTSTIWMAYALEKLGGRLVSVDHDPGYAERTRTLLRAHGLDGVAEVRLAALRPLTVHGEEFQWYDTDALADVNDIDLLLVDGPPGATGPIARYPAVPVLLDRLSSTAAVVLDDMVRQDEQEVVRRWTSTVTGLAREREFFDRVAVLRYSRFES
jgi:predicted O-methyltransferase YrrM